jgi:hypothetical protein
MRIAMLMLTTTLAACKLTSVNADAGGAAPGVSSATAPEPSAAQLAASADAGPPPVLQWPPVACSAPSGSAATSHAASSSGPALVLRPKDGKPIPLRHGYALLTDDGVVLRWNDEDTTCPARLLPVDVSVGSGQITTLMPAGPGAKYFAGRPVRVHVNEVLMPTPPVAADDAWLTLQPFDARIGAHVRGSMQFGRDKNAQGGGAFDLVVCADERTDCSVLPEHAPDVPVGGTSGGHPVTLRNVKLVVAQKGPDEPRQLSELRFFSMMSMSCGHWSAAALDARVALDSPEPRWKELQDHPIPVRMLQKNGHAVTVDGYLLLDTLDLAARRARGEILARKASFDGSPLEIAGRFDAQVCLP